MKNIKTFENYGDDIERLKRVPKVGDYVLCEEKSYENDRLIEFISSNFGIIITIHLDKNYPYAIKYENIPQNVQRFFENGVREFSSDEIERFADEQEIEQYKLEINANKYNI